MSECGPDRAGVGARVCVARDIAAADGQVGQLTLDGARTRLRQADHLVRVEAAVRRAEQHGQHALAHLGEEGGGGGRKG